MGLYETLFTPPVFFRGRRHSVNVSRGQSRRQGRWTPELYRDKPLGFRGTSALVLPNLLNGSVI